MTMSPLEVWILAQSRAAAEMGGGLEGNPRQSRILLIASGGLIAHKILIRLR